MAIIQHSGLERPVDLAEHEIELVEDAGEAIRRARSEAQRVVIAESGRPVAAVVPIDDLYLLLRLEEAELDRLDLEEIRNREADSDEAPIPWDVAKKQLGL
jgi:prevent-host-death family protein